MREDTKSIGFACALGAFIGALLALEFKARFQYGMYLWLVGALIGGSTAYIVVDFREFCSGVARAYRATIAWKPFVPFWKAFGARFLAHLSATFTILLVLGTIILFGDMEKNHLSARFFGDISMFFLGYIALAAILITVLNPFSLLEPIRRREKWLNETDSDYKFRLHFEKKESFESFLCTNPIGIIIILFCLIVVKPFCLIYNVFWFDIKKLVVKAFFYVHSDRRTICFVDSILGATAGFFYGSAFIGAVVGAVLGMANYELVSIRWLKLAPVKV